MKHRSLLIAVVVVMCAGLVGTVAAQAGARAERARSRRHDEVHASSADQAEWCPV